MNRNMLLLGVLVLVLIVAATALVLTVAPPPSGSAPAADKHADEAANKADETPKGNETPAAEQQPSQENLIMPDAKGPRTRVKVETSMGDFEMLLFDDLVPKTSKNFVELTNKGFYNGLTFHRVIPNFVIQGGDPNGNGSGGPGYTIADEYIGIRHAQPGQVAMARTPAPNSAGSQFYVTVAALPGLDQDPRTKYCIFGQVVKGMDVVYAISKVARDPSDKPVTPVVMKSVTIIGTQAPGAESTAAK